MKVTLARKSDYSVRAMLDLARHYGSGRRKARQIARTMDIPERYLPQVMAPLVRAGLVVATAGPDGGYALARAPREVTLLEVIETAEGPVAGDRCILEGGPCDWETVCPVHEAWTRTQGALSRELGRTTFRELAAKDRLLETGEAPPLVEPAHPRSVPRRGQRT